MIERLGRDDKDWILGIWKHYEPVLGRSPSTIWYRAWQNPGDNEFWVGIRPHAFAHYRVRKADGIKVLYEIATDPSLKRKGYARQLIQHIGFPMELKTDALHAESNAFYVSLGFKLAGQKSDREGTKLMNIYRRL